MAVKEVNGIGSISKYLEYIETNCKVRYVLFRGQPDDDDLIPKLGIIGKSSMAIIEKNNRDSHLFLYF